MIAKWNGAVWTPLGTVGISSHSVIPFGLISVLHAFDDGTGPALYVGGFFETVDGKPANGIAKWDGSIWTSVGGGVRPQAQGCTAAAQGVETLAAFDDGTGPALYGGGTFCTVGGRPESRIAKWDGTVWTSLGSGISFLGGFGTPRVDGLTTFDDGTGPALFVAGQFSMAGGAPSNMIAKWGVRHR
jgi:hypothetical protein